MKVLLIMRHAKSSWGDESLSDHERPLNRRGLKSAPQMGELLIRERLVPQRIVSSTAQRARQTAQLVADTLGCPETLVWTDSLYHAACHDLIEIIQHLDAADDRVMLVGHNPGMAELLALLSGKPSHFPTAAIAHVQFDSTDWSDAVTSVPGRLLHLWLPRELD